MVTATSADLPVSLNQPQYSKFSLNRPPILRGNRWYITSGLDITGVVLPVTIVTQQENISGGSWFAICEICKKQKAG
jgi:hypothetical protein